MSCGTNLTRGSSRTDAGVTPRAGGAHLTRQGADPEIEWLFGNPSTLGFPVIFLCARLKRAGQFLMQFDRTVSKAGIKYVIWEFARGIGRRFLMICLASMVLSWISRDDAAAKHRLVSTISHLSPNRGMGATAVRTVHELLDHYRLAEAGRRFGRQRFPVAHVRIIVGTLIEVGLKGRARRRFPR